MRINNNEKKAVRRSFYFSPKNLDLLEFLESNSELSPNEFLIEILRQAKDSTCKTPTNDLTNLELYHKLELLISNLQPTQKSINSTDVESVQKSSPQIPVFSKKSLRDMDDIL